MSIWPLLVKIWTICNCEFDASFLTFLGLYLLVFLRYIWEKARINNGRKFEFTSWLCYYYCTNSILAADLEDDEEEVSSTTSSKKHKKHKKEKKSKKSKKKSKKKEKEKDRDKDKEKEKEKKEKDKKEKEKEIINNSDSEEPTTMESPPLVLPQAEGNFEFCVKGQ